MLLNPDAIPRIALDSMNRVHLEEVDLINDVDALIRAKAAGEEVQDALSAKLEEWVAHTQAHFAAEEEKMRAAGFPAYPVHKGEHDRILDEVGALVEKWKTSGDSGDLERWIQEVLPGWIGQHIATMDTMTAQFVAAQTGPDA